MRMRLQRKFPINVRGEASGRACNEVSMDVDLNVGYEFKANITTATQEPRG